MAGGTSRWHSRSRGPTQPPESPGATWCPTAAPTARLPKSRAPVGAALASRHRRPLLLRAALPRQAQDPQRLAGEAPSATPPVVELRRPPPPARAGPLPLVRLAGVRRARGAALRTATRAVELLDAALKLAQHWNPAGSPDAYLLAVSRCHDA